MTKQRKTRKTLSTTNNLSAAVSAYLLGRSAEQQKPSPSFGQEHKMKTREEINIIDGVVKMKDGYFELPQPYRSAPDLLEAAKNTLKGLEECPQQFCHEPLQVALRAAIQKAEGHV